MPPPEAKRLLDFILAQAGLAAGAYRSTPLQRRLPACLRALGTRSPADAVEILKRSPDRLDGVLDALLIGVTGPFRDPPLFSALAGLALPDLLRRRPPRIWSVGCSDGSELYSVAMLLAELAGVAALERAELIGTDCRPNAVRKATAGWLESLEDVPAPIAARYLVREAAAWRVVPEIRRRVRFECADAVRSLPARPGHFDLVLCRNLVIYLAPEVVADLWSRLLDSLAPGGYLAVGKAERIRFQGLRGVAPCLYRKQELEHDR